MLFCFLLGKHPQQQGMCEWENVKICGIPGDSPLWIDLVPSSWQTAIVERYIKANNILLLEDKTQRNNHLLANMAVDIA